MRLSCCSVNQAQARNSWRVRCTTRPPGVSNVLLPSTVLPFPKHCSRASCSDTSEVRLQAPPSRPLGASKLRIKARFFSMRSAICPRHCRPNCYVSCKNDLLRGWVEERKFLLTCALSVPRTKICRQELLRERFAKICFIGWRE